MKILLLVNVLNPYLVSRFETIASIDNVELSVLVEARNERNRKWQRHSEKDYSFKTKILPGFHLHVGKKDSYSFHFNYSLKKILNHKKPDLMVFLGWSNPTTYFFARVCNRLEIPLIAWSGSTVNEPSLFRRIGAPAIRWLHRRCSAFFAYGTAAKELLMEHWKLPETKIFVLGNPVDNEFFKNESDQARNKKDIYHPAFKDGKVILFVGQLIERKGLKELVKAFKSIQPKHPEAKLVIAGTGPLNIWLQEYLNEHQDLQVFPLGYVEYEHLPGLYAHSSIFCLPSREEVWGLVINEAMASGVPVIASDVCGASRDLLLEGETGLVFRHNDSEHLAEKLGLLLENEKLRKNIAEKGRKHVMQWGLEKFKNSFVKGIHFALQEKSKKHHL